MSTRARLQNANDSKSLWNYTLSPGWSTFDAHILRLAVMKYGCGAWRDIGRHFPLKNCNQLNLQTQRLFGQQALAEFNKVHVDPNRIKIVNDQIEGFRKNTCLINTGNNLSVEERAKRREQHIEKYGIPKQLYSNIEIPVVLDPPQMPRSVIDDIEKLREMYRCIYDIQLRVRHLRRNKSKNAAKIALNAKKINAKKNKTKKKSVSNVEDNDVEMSENNKNKNKNKNENIESKNGEVMDEDVAMAMALSVSFAEANINTPVPKPKKKKRSRTGSKKSSSKSKGRKRKRMDDETNIAKPGKKRVKTK